MKKLVKIIIVVVVIAAVIGIASSLFGDKSETGIELIQFDEDTLITGDTLYLDLNDTESSKKNVGVLIEAGEDFSTDDLQFISANENIATIAITSAKPYESDDYKTYNNIVYCDITGVSAGSTNVYVQTTDGEVKSNEIVVQVTGDSAYPELEALPGKSLYDAMHQISDSGYTATYYHTDSKMEYNGEIDAFTDDELQNKWVVTECDNIDTDKKTLDVYINTKENIEEASSQQAVEAALSEKLSAATAWQAVKEYGQSQYIYGFDLHTIVGVLAEEAEDENTWFLKAKVTITNEYNAEADMTCEARVTGTDANPQVVDFSVY